MLILLQKKTFKANDMPLLKYGLFMFQALIGFMYRTKHAFAIM